MTGFHRTALGITLLLGLAAPLSAQTRAVAPILPPLVESDDGLNANGGQAYEIVAEAARRAGLTLRVEVQPWPRALATATATEDVLLFPVARTPDREDLFEWLGPVNRLDYRVYRLKGGSAPSLTSLDQLKGHSLSMLRSDIVHNFLLGKGLILEPTGQIESSVALLLANRVEYVATTPTTMRAELAKAGRAGAAESLFSIEDVTPDPYSYVVAAKGSRPALTDALRRALDSMRRDGAWEKIFQRYQ